MSQGAKEAVEEAHEEAVEAVNDIAEAAIPVAAKVKKLRACKNNAERINNKCPKSTLKRCKTGVGRDSNGNCNPGSRSLLRMKIMEDYPANSRAEKIGRMRKPTLENYLAKLMGNEVPKKKRKTRTKMSESRKQAALREALTGTTSTDNVAAAALGGFSRRRR